MSESRIFPENDAELELEIEELIEGLRGPDGRWPSVRYLAQHIAHLLSTQPNTQTKGEQQ